MSKFLTTIQSLPSQPGVYIFKDKSGAILYVGKANNLKNRVSSYFQKGSALMPGKPRTLQNSSTTHKDLFHRHSSSSQTIGYPSKVRGKQKMLAKIRKIEHQIADSEIEALILELELIKKYRPKYNIAFKDDKHFQYIIIDYYSDDFPKILTARKKKNDRADYFGPFPSSRTVKQILNLLNRLFHYRECRVKITETSVRAKKYRICLRYHLGRCYAPCVGKISKKEYLRSIKQCKMFLEGKKTDILHDLENSMKTASKQQNYEEAARLRDQILGIKQISAKQKEGQNLTFLDGRTKVKNGKNVILELKKILNLPTKPKRIECFDISNIQGVFATGSMVVFKNGAPAKNEYRRFKIRVGKKPNDVAMMKEMLMRRFRHSTGITKLARSGVTKLAWSMTKQASSLQLKPWPLPNLIVIDGGKGQLGAALKTLKYYHLNIPAIALAKRNEEIYLPPRQNPLILPKNSPTIFLLQRLRDEAHRFAITYHKKLRKKLFLT